MTMPAPINAPVPQTLPEMLAFADIVVRSGLALGHKTKESVVIALQFGLELGLKPMQALRMVAVISGKPSLSADGCVAVVLESGLAEYFHEVENDGKRSTWATKRRGSPQERRYTFTLEMAKAAKLTGGAGMYEKYAERMLAARAKKYLAQDVYPDVIGGMQSTEELQVMAVEAGGRPGGDLVSSHPDLASLYPEPRRVGEHSPAPAATVVLEGETVDTATGEVLTLDGKQSAEEQYGKLVTQKEIGSMMGAIDRAGITSEALKQYMLDTWGLTSRKALRKGHLMEIGAWIAGSAEAREPGGEG